MSQEKRIQIIFREETPYGTYQDALWFTETEYANTTKEQIDAMKQARIDNWISVVTAPAPIVTAEDIQKEIDSQQEMIVNLNSRIAELQVKKSNLTATVIKDI